MALSLWPGPPFSHSFIPQEGEGALKATCTAWRRPIQTLPGGTQEGHRPLSGQAVPSLIAPPTSSSDAFECRTSARDSPGWHWITSTSICLVLHRQRRKTRGQPVTLGRGQSAGVPSSQPRSAALMAQRLKGSLRSCPAGGHMACCDSRKCT